MVSSITRIAQLSSTIASNTTLIDEYFTSHSLASPSLDASAPAQLPIPPDAPQIAKARQEVIDATAELNAIMKGPSELLRVAWTDNVSLHAIVRWEMAKTFPVGETATYEEIAGRTGTTDASAREGRSGRRALDERTVKRLLRHGMSGGRYLFEEVLEGSDKGKVRHSALTKILAQEQTVHDNVINGLDELWPSATRLVDALEKWPGSGENNETAWSLANNTNLSMWQTYEADPVRGEKFGKGMSGMDKVKGYEPSLLIDGYQWAEVGKSIGAGTGIVVDVGGSHGTVMKNVAGAFPQLKFVVQDLKKVVEEGRKMVPEELKDRVELMEHDFFTPQPVSGDVYYMRSILHNWSDKYSLKILQSLVPALKKGARILVHELVVPEPGTVPGAAEARIRHMDIGMMQLLNASQRDASEWKDLFRRADEGFKFVGIRKPEGAAQSIIEWEWA
jgi:hypothetical protein